jgi:hypothetical protein
MTKLSFLSRSAILTLAFVVGSVLGAAAQWVQKANFGGTARQSGVAFSVGTKGYMGLGYDGTRRNDFWEYDPATDTWAQVANYGGTARELPAAFVIGSIAYVGFGNDVNSTLRNDLWAYNPTTNSWSAKASCPGAGRQQPVAFAVSGKGYVGTGWDGGGNLSDFWEYDPTTNSWTQKANYGGGGVRHAVGFAIGSNGYVAMGYSTGRTSACYAFDPVANTWTARASVPLSAAAGTGFVLNGKGYVGTGDIASGTYSAAVYAYDPVANSWASVGTTGFNARQAAMAFSIGAKGYIGAGNAATQFRDLWEYTPPPAPIVSSFTPTTGPAGTSVIITGSNFAAISSVSFGGGTASFTVNSPTQITATVPMTAVTGPITVSNVGGAGSSATNFTAVLLPYINSFSPTSGLAGATVTLSGTNFTGTTAVAFNGTAATFTVNSATQITATVPANVTTGPIAVTNAVGTFTSTTNFTVTPTITSFSPASGPTGTVVTVNGTNFTGATIVRVNTSTAPSFAVLSPTQLTLIVPPTATSGVIRVTVGAATGLSATSYIVTTGANQAPTQVALSPLTSPENVPVNTAVGTLTTTDPNAGDTFTYSLVPGTGSADNASFTISGNSLRFSVSPDFETKSSYAIRIRTTDQGGLAVERAFTVTITNVAESPTALALSNTTVDENVAANTVIGSLTSTDPNAGSTFTYSLVSGIGSTDNGAFSLAGNSLRLNASPDFEAKSSYEVRLRTTDAGGLFFEQAFLITVNDLNEAPTALTLSATSIDENVAAGATVGLLTTTDPDAGNTFTYTLVGGTGSADNAAFSLTGGTLTLNASPDYEAQNSYAIRVRTTDQGGLFFEQAFGVTVNDIAENLTVSAVQSLPAGLYNNLTVTGAGVLTLTGDLTVNGALVVQAGGVLNTGCQVITGSGAFTLAPGATLAICNAAGISATDPTGAVQVQGARTFSPAADYTYNGTVAQITGTGLPATVRVLQIDNPAGVSLTQATAVRNVLRLTNGVFNTNSQTLTLLSDATGTAYAVPVNGSTSGAVTVKRYVGGPAPVSHRHLSSPVAAAPMSDLATTGFTPVVNTAFNTIPTPAIPAAQYPTIFGFDETRGGAVANFTLGYYSPAALTSILTPGRGWDVTMAGSKTPDFVGNLTTGTITMSGLTRTGAFLAAGEKSGWHLLGNPYPQPIDWDLATVPTGMDAAIFVYRTTGGNNGNYLTRANGLGTLTDGVIALGQGFWTRVTSATPVSFSFTNALRVENNTAAVARAAQDTRPVVSLTLTPAGGPVAEAGDETFMYVEAGATLGRDARFDALRPGRNLGAPTLASVLAGEEAAINGLPESVLTTPTIIELTAALPTAGRYELGVGRLEHFGGTAVALLDRLTGTRYDLRQNPVVSLVATRADEVVAGRFALLLNGQRVLGTSAAAGQASLVILPNPASASTSVRVTGGLASSPVSLFDATGRRVATVMADTAGAADVSTAGKAPGVYVVRVADGRTLRLVIE